MDPMVTAMWSHERKVRSLAKKVLGSMRIGVVRAMTGGSLGLRLLKYQSKKPFFSFLRPKPAHLHHTTSAKHSRSLQIMIAQRAWTAISGTLPTQHRHMQECAGVASSL